MKHLFLLLFFTSSIYAKDFIPVSLDRNNESVSVEWFYDFSENGQFIIFSSNSNNIVPNDTNSLNRSFDERGPASDVFLLDRETDEIKRVSLRHDGGQIENGRSFFSSVDRNFHNILYTSEGNSQFPGDTVQYENAADTDLYLYNTLVNETKWLSVAPDGSEVDTNSAVAKSVISGNGKYTLFSTGATNILPVTSSIDSFAEIILMDNETQERELISIGIDGMKTSAFPREMAINFDGRYIAYVSTATNLTVEKTGGIFLRDMQTKTTELISRNPDGVPIQFESLFKPENLDISDDGRYILFFSPSSQHVENDPHPEERIGMDGFIYDRLTKQTKIISLDGFELQNRESGIVKGSMSSNGRYVIGVTRIDNGATRPELFLYDQFKNTVELLLSPEKNHPLIQIPNIFGIPRITSDGKHVLFSNAVYDGGGRFLQSSILYLMTRDVTTSHIDAWDWVE